MYFSVLLMLLAVGLRDISSENIVLISILDYNSFFLSKKRCLFPLFYKFYS
ncbi:MAG: hypothetical protein HRT41_12820 [Campylobacteraceae bacterium]|nr:hypothetical protein [Campylobacteraceae bacterium]